MTRIWGLIDPAVHANLYGHMQGLLTQPWMFGIYLIGLLLAVFHLANGLWGMGVVWGLTTSVRAQRLMARACAGIGVLLSALGLHGLIGFLS